MLNDPGNFNKFWSNTQDSIRRTVRGAAPPKTKYRYKVEDGIPLSEKSRKNGGSNGAGRARSTYPWSIMSIGQSFLVPLEDVTDAYSIPRAIYFRHIAHDKGGRFTYRRRYMNEHNEEGFRVWRVS